MTNLVVNHKEATLLARAKAEKSNLARCYLAQRDEIERLQKDADRLDWYEAQHTLHKSLELLYAVDRYELDVLRDGHTHLEFHGQSLRECIDAARGADEPEPKP